MKIEILYPEICTLYGDKGNIMLLSQCLPKAELIYTELNQTPRFLEEPIELVYMCSMSEKNQELILKEWLPIQPQICNAIQNGPTFFLFTGNAFELLAHKIQREDGSIILGLNLIPDMKVIRQAPDRFNSLIKAKFKGMTLIGYTSRFSHAYGVPNEQAFCQVEIGTGINPDTKYEGYRSKHCIATYLLGPMLIQNPDFVHFLLEKLGAPLTELPYEAALREAYAVKLKEFDQPGLLLY